MNSETENLIGFSSKEEKEVFFQAMDNDDVEFFKSYYKNQTHEIKSINFSQACPRGSLNVLKFFLESYKPNEEELTSMLSLSCTWDKIEIVKFLLENLKFSSKAINLSFKRVVGFHSDIEIPKMLVKYGAEISWNGEQPLRNAIFLEGPAYMVEFLLQNGANPKVMDSYLLLESIQRKKQGFIIPNLLIQYGIDAHNHNEGISRLLIKEIIANEATPNETNIVRNKEIYEFLSSILDGVDFSPIINHCVTGELEKTQMVLSNIQKNILYKHQNIEDKLNKFSYPKI